MEIPEKVWAKVEQNENGCWMWKGLCDKKGYGRVTDAGRLRVAHRYFYTKVVGPIPEGLVIDHLCYEPGCVNPAHLEAVTGLENARRQRDYGAAKMRRSMTHCKRGHEFTPENTYTFRNMRTCRACKRQAERRRKRRAA